MPRKPAAQPVTVEAALDRSLASMKLTPSDEAAQALAREYAKAIDGNPEMLAKVGARLLETLVELGMTPKARAAVMKGATPPAGVSKLDELRAKREQKARPAR